MTNIEIRLKDMYINLNNSEKKIADYLFENTESIFHMPISQLANESGVSQVAWVRFCKTMGYSGLKGLKRQLFVEINESATENIKVNKLEFTDIKNFSSLNQITDYITQSSIQSIENTAKLLNFQQLSEIVDKIILSSSVQIFGVGASGLVGSDLYYKLIRIGKKTVFDRDVHIQLTYAANLCKDDIGMFISNSGLTKEIIDTFNVAKESGATLISITRFSKNPLALGCDHSLYTSTPEVDKRSGAMSSRIAQLTLIDILFTAIANKNYNNVEKMLEQSYNACHSHKINNL